MRYRLRRRHRSAWLDAEGHITMDPAAALTFRREGGAAKYLAHDIPEEMRPLYEIEPMDDEPPPPEAA